MSAVPAETPGLLTGLVAAPAVMALGLTVAGALAQRAGAPDRAPSGAWRAMGQAFTGALFVVGASLLWLGFDAEHIGLQLAERIELLPQYGIQLHFAVDGLSLLPVLLVLFVVPLAGFPPPSQTARATPGGVARVLLLEAFVLGVLLSIDWMQLFVFWLWLLLPTFFVIASWGGVDARRHAMAWLVPAAIGSAAMLFVLLVVHRLGYQQLGVWVFDLVGRNGRVVPGLFDVVIANEGPWWVTQTGLFALFLFAVAVRVRVFPFHVWTTSATENAPIEGGVLVDGLQLVVAVHLLVRVGLPLMPDGAAALVPVASGAGLVGLAWGGLVAGAQRDVRSLLGFAQTAALGLTTIGIFTLREHGIVGGLLQAWSVFLAGAMLLVLLGMLVERRGSTSFDAYGGLAKPMPVFSLLLAAAFFALSAIPGSLGFVGELLVLAGGFARSPALALAALGGVLLVGTCLIRGYRALALGPVTNAENRGLIDLGWRERVVVLALLVPLVGFGVYPNPALRRLEPAVLEMLHTMEVRSARTAAVAAEADAKAGETAAADGAASAGGETAADRASRQGDSRDDRVARAGVGRP